MTAYEYTSPLASLIAEYVLLRISIGNKPETFERRLASFDRYCVEHDLSEAAVTRDMAEGWCTLKSGESPTTLALRVCVLNGFSRYLLSIGLKAWVLPERYVNGQSTFMPYIYSDSELSAFFSGADALGSHPLSPLREYIIPVLFRMMYCCGLRPQEAIALKLADVDFADGVVCIVDSKHHKDRIVPMSYDLAALCLKYEEALSTMIPDREHFFEGPSRKPYGAAWVQSQFRKCWRKAGIEFSGQKPRVYDWRHNFATRTIAGWMDADLDVANMLPRLSIYMGHSSIRHTIHYIHLVPNHRGLSKRSAWACPGEVPVYED